MNGQTTEESKLNDTSVCLEVKDIVKKFGAVTAVDGVSLKIRDGEIFSLIGSSGCGKTTLLRIVAGLETPTEGEVLIDNNFVNLVPPHKRDCSIVFQQLALFPHMTVKQNIAFGLERKNMPKEEIETRIEDILKIVQLEGLEKRKPQQLSGGQQQRVALARSLVIRPKILLLDEPLASLDRKLRKEMQLELRRIQKKVKTTFLYVTHDQKVALSLSDRIGVMENGKVVQLGTPEEIYESPKTSFVANFMGASNIISGKVSNVKDGKIQIDTDDGHKVFTVERNDVHNEDIVGIAINPNALEITEKETKTKSLNTLFGTVNEIFYQGDFAEITVVLEKSSQLITVHQNIMAGEHLAACPGQEVQVHWNERHSISLVG